MVVNVIYESKKGHTETVANAVAAECGVQAIDITVPHVLPETDLLFIGTGIYAGKPDSALLDYLDQLPANKIKGAAIFSTSARGRSQTELMMNLLSHKGIEIYPRQFACRGQFLFLSVRHPDARDLSTAKAWARSVLDACNI